MMQLPVQITFRNMDTSDALEATVRQRAEALERHCPDIIACRVVLEARHRRHRKGKLYHVRVDISVPGRDIVAARDPSDDHAHEDMSVAIRDAFDAARRQLEDHTRRARGETKNHQAPSEPG